MWEKWERLLRKKNTDFHHTVGHQNCFLTRKGLCGGRSDTGKKSQRKVRGEIAQETERESRLWSELLSQERVLVQPHI